VNELVVFCISQDDIPGRNDNAKQRSYRGEVSLRKNQHVVKLRFQDETSMIGTYIGWIYDFDDEGRA
jgi:hypothetical protein